jgi:predicted transcriptional regulator
MHRAWGEKVQLRSLVSLLDCQVLCGHKELDAEVTSCFAADLMSDVLAFSIPHTLLITGLTSIQSVHTADVAECTGILLVSGKQPSPEALQLAKAKEFPLLTTKHSMFVACGILSRNGLAAARKT